MNSTILIKLKELFDDEKFEELKSLIKEELNKNRNFIN